MGFVGEGGPQFLVIWPNIVMIVFCLLLDVVIFFARVVKEAKRMASENVSARKKLSSEQERWRSSQRSKAKKDERRRMELERKSNDVYALQYR